MKNSAIFSQSRSIGSVIRTVLVVGSLSALMGCGNTDGDSAKDGGTVTTVLDSYCASATELLESCSDSASFSPCETSTLENCHAVYGGEREEYITARSECGLPDNCGDLSDFEQSLCIFQKTENMTPTTNQEELAQVLCDSCGGDDVAGCLEGFFFRAEPRDDGSVGVSGQGTTYMHLDSTSTAMIADACAPQIGADRCWQQFFDCVREQIESDYPASHVDSCRPVGPSI